MSQPIDKFAIVSFELASMLVSAAALVLFSLLLNLVYVYFEGSPFVIILFIILVFGGLWVGFFAEPAHDGLAKMMRGVAGAMTLSLIYGAIVGAVWISDYIRLEQGDHEARESVARAHEDHGAWGYRSYKDGHIEFGLSGEYIFDEHGDSETSYIAAPVVGPEWRRDKAVTLWVIGLDMQRKDWERWQDRATPIQGVLFQDKYGARAIKVATREHKLAASTKPVMLRLRAKSYEELAASSAAGTKWSMIIAALVWCALWLLIRASWFKKIIWSPRAAEDASL